MATTYTIGRGEGCDIQVPMNKSKIGNHHATIIVNDKGNIIIEKVKEVKKGKERIAKNYQIFVNGFRVNRKQISQTDIIDFENQFKFQIHYYFKFKNDKIIGRRKGNDYTDEMREKAATWKTIEAAKKNIDWGSIVIIGSISLGLGVFSYSLSNNQWIPILISSSTFAILQIIRTMTSTHKEKTIKEIKENNSCPKCSTFLEGTWDNIKETGHHEKCGAYWKL